MHTDNKSGVYTARKKDNSIYYRASITYRRKHISLGSFDTQDAASQVYWEATRILATDDSLDQIGRYSVIPFHKLVVLVNFRDNGIYFPTPIYLRPKFFYYYLEPLLRLQFDIDDLFYYASHKIMKRGGHLFVSDYGMQVNILNRYGIRNFAVQDRDYRFLNGDSCDFRYENIEIINKYYGVQKKEKNGKIYYHTEIHIKNNYLVGKYNTENEAAVAYNKAIDILQKKGVKKNFTPNYLADVLPSVYADIYSSCKISPKILHYTAPAGRAE